MRPRRFEDHQPTRPPYPHAGHHRPEYVDAIDRNGRTSSIGIRASSRLAPTVDRMAAALNVALKRAERARIYRLLCEKAVCNPPSKLANPLKQAALPWIERSRLETFPFEQQEALL